MADAYKVLRAVSLPKALNRLAEDDVEGNPRYATQGKLYSEEEYVLASDITPPLRERIENGDLEDFLVEVPLEEAQEGLRTQQYSTFVPEHEVERVTLANYGHNVVSRENALALNAAGADAARAAQEKALEDGAGDRPAITEQDTFMEVPSLADASREGKTVLGEDKVAVELDPEQESIQTMPSGVVGGAVKAAAEEGGPALTPTVVTEDGAGKKAVTAARKRPGQPGAAKAKAEPKPKQPASEDKKD